MQDVRWPSQADFELAARYTRPGTVRHVAAALMIGSSVTMEKVEAVVGAPQYNVVALLKDQHTSCAAQYCSSKL
jgi:hypothetical protein